jgi:carbon-monoxide dehydrogenase medium subunit
MAEFYRGPYETARAPRRDAHRAQIPAAAARLVAYEKVGRRAGDWAVVSCGVAVWLEAA